jgi:hypothetical protein
MEYNLKKRSHQSTKRLQQQARPTNTYSCAATVSSCTASYTVTATPQTTVVGCCATGDNCFANTVAAPLTCNTATGTVGMSKWDL